jgi:hypothetical protein
MSFSSSLAQDGHALFSSCQNVKYLQKQAIDTQTSVFEAGYCLGMIYGVYATLNKFNTDKQICLPILGINNQRKVEIILNHLKNNSQHLEKEDVVLIMDAFQTAFPCPSNKK